MNKLKKALFFSGSGSNSVQEVAVVDRLLRNDRVTFSEKDTLLIASGTGALNLIAVNACFRNENPLSWDDFTKTNSLDG